MTIDATVARSPEDDEPRRSPELRSPEPVQPFEGTPGRSKAWRYYICILLLMATTINYIDRQALAQLKTTIETPQELNLSNENYGEIEQWFAYAFAGGAFLFGIIADKVNVYWLYPLVLALWSAMGFCSGLVHSFAGLLLCRTFLGLFEAGHWPCALRTTQRLLPAGERTLGNSILQSGSSIGAAFAPFIVNALQTDEQGSWRFVFQAIGLIGAVWIAFWLTALRPRDLRHPVAASKPVDVDAARPSAAEYDTPFWRVVVSQRFLTLCIVVVAINCFWHFFRAWLPDVLEKVAGYSKTQTRYISMAFYFITDVGCIIAGYLTFRLARGGMSLERARLATFTGCGVLAACSFIIPWLPHGWPLIAALMTVGLGALGLFPCYYTFTQELSVTHQGKVTGLLGALAWIGSAPLHKMLGRYVDLHIGEPTRYDPAFWFAGLCPVVAVAALWLLWTPARETRHT
jgi:ACS family hexuronate transporter-like MFS transporter